MDLLEELRFSFRDSQEFLGELGIAIVLGRFLVGRAPLATPIGLCLYASAIVRRFNMRDDPGLIRERMLDQLYSSTQVILSSGCIGTTSAKVFLVTMRGM